MGTTHQQLRDIEIGKSSQQGITYRLKAVPKRFQKAGDDRTAFVQVMPNETIHKSAFIGKIVKDSLVDPAIVKYVLEKMTDVILTELSAGNTISIDDHFKFGVSIPGRVSPQHPEDVAKLKVLPTMRFSQPFHRALNRLKKVSYFSNYQPPLVQVDELFVLGSGCRAVGKFHNIHSLIVDMLIGEAVVPCRYELNKDKNSTRDIGTQLTIIPKSLPTPPGARRVRFSYVDATGERQNVILDAADTGL